jgi:predicted MFS family arabinose efflux permease
MAHADVPLSFPAMPAASRRSLNPFHVLVTHRAFRLFWLGQTLSLVGTWMQQMGQGWLALELTDSASLVTLVRLMGALPIVAFSFVAGAVADRRDKLRLVFTMQALMLAEAIALWWFTWTDHVTIGVLIALTAANGLFSAFEIPARQSMMIDLVGRDDLHEAIALNSSGFNLARIVGPAIGALVIGALGLAWCFGFNALSYLAVLVSLVLIARMSAPLRPGVAARPLGAIWHEIGDGLRYIRRTEPVNALMKLVTVFSICAVPYLALMPVMARDVLGLGARGYGGLLTCVGIGGLAGALFLASAGQRISRPRLLRVASLGFPTLLVAFSFAPNASVAYVILLFVGATMILNGALANGILQTIVDDAFRGRLMAVYSFVVVGMAEVMGSGISGPVADRIGAAWTIRGAALIMLGYTSWAFLRGSALRRLVVHGARHEG